MLVINNMLDTAKQFIQSVNNIVIIQAENPDGDSLGFQAGAGRSLNGKTVTLHCPVDIPKYFNIFMLTRRTTFRFADAAIMMRGRASQYS